MITQAQNIESLVTWFPLICYGLFILGLIIGTIIGYKQGKQEEGKA